MTIRMGMLALGLLTMGRASQNPPILRGVQCGDLRCSTDQYCNPYDKHCKPCSDICDPTSSNYQSAECFADCQEYLRDQKYALLQHYEDLREEVGRLWILVTIATVAAVLSLLSSIYLFTKRLPRWEKMRSALTRVFTGKWIKKTNNATGNGNDRRNHNNNRVQEDPELGISKHNGLKLTMPTISATVAPSRDPERGNESGNASGSTSRNGSGSGTGHATPNTVSTTLSRRHPSEDTTLDYAYDNPAMTPSPETVQIRAKRESSF